MPNVRTPVLGHRQRFILAFVVERGGTTLVQDTRAIDVAWVRNKWEVVKITKALIARGCLTVREAEVEPTSRVYVTDKGRSMIKDARATLVAQSYRHAGILGNRFRSMLPDIEKVLEQGGKVCVVVKNAARKREVQRAIRYSYQNYDILVATPKECGIDWVGMDVRGHTTFVEPSLLEDVLSDHLSHLKKYSDEAQHADV